MSDWSQSTPMRWVGLSGLKLTRDINRNYLLTLANVIPETRRDIGAARTWSTPPREQGWQSGNGFADCGTCHHSAPIPTVGVGLAKTFPTLKTTGPQSQAAATPMPATQSAPARARS
jgi:hypothetical protein